MSQCLLLVRRFYLGPLFSRSNSLLEKVMSVLLTTLGKKGWVFGGCCLLFGESVSNLLSGVLYLDLIVFWRLSSIYSWM